MFTDILLGVVAILLVVLIGINLSNASKHKQVAEGVKGLSDSSLEQRGTLSTKDDVIGIKDTLLNTSEGTSGKMTELIQANKETIASTEEAKRTALEINELLRLLDTKVTGINDVFTNNQARGALGETLLNSVLTGVYGEKNDLMYKLQYQIPNTASLSDAAIFPYGQDGLVLAIDSKFPLSGYHDVIQETLHPTNKSRAQREFAKNVKARVDEIASKYIIEDTTLPYAIMFLPAEAVYQYINSYHQDDVVSYAQNKGVLIVGPNSLVAVMLTINSISIDIVKNKESKVLLDALATIAPDMERLEVRLNSLSTLMDRANKEYDNVLISSSKLVKKFNQIKIGELPNEEVELITEDSED